jgi:CHASE2 domain-containing sensor protein
MAMAQQFLVYPTNLSAFVTSVTWLIWGLHHTTSEKNFQFGNVVFKNLEENSGGYHGIDNLGHQVLLNCVLTSNCSQVTLKEVLNNDLRQI